MYGRNIRSRLDLVKPNTADVVYKKQHKVPTHVGSNIREFNNGQSTLVRDYRKRQGQDWFTFDVNVSTWRRHVDQMKNSAT